MADTDIVQVIAEARIDARSLSEFVFKPADFMVQRRLAPSIHTMQYYIELFEKTAQDGAIEIGRAIINSGFITVDSFELGATITQRNQALRRTADGKLYRWAGNLPKVVPVSSTPASTGGFGDNAWLEVSDAALRTQLAAPFGANLIGRTVITLDSVYDMRRDVMTSENRRSDVTYVLRSFHSGRNLGGGLFYWDATRSKTEHNGGTVIDPHKDVFSISEPNQSEVSNWFTANPSSFGVFVKMPNSYVSPTEFGSVGENHIVDQAAFNAASKSSSSLFIEPLKDGGSYILDLFNPLSDTEVWGVGAASKIKLAAGDKGDTNAEYGGALLVRGRERVILRNFLVDGNKENVTGLARVNIECVNFKECNDCHSIDLITINSVSDGIDLDDCVDCTSTRIQAFDCDGYGVHISERSVRCHTYNSTSTRCGIAGTRGGFDIYGSATHSSINNCISIGCWIGANVEGGTNSVTNHKSYDDVKHGVYVHNSATSSGAFVQGTVGSGDANDAGVRIGTNARVYGGVVRDCLTHGVLAAGSGSSISTTKISSNTGKGLMIAVDTQSSGTVHIDGVLSQSNTGGNYENRFSTPVTGGNNIIGGLFPDMPIGSTSLLAVVSGAGIGIGEVVSGSRLRYSGTSGAVLDNVNVPAGSWRCLSPSNGTGSPAADRIALYVRVI